MTNKTRLQKLESVALGVEPDDRQFVQRITAEGVKYLIDGVEVDAAKFKREHVRGHEDQKISVTILGLDQIKDDE